MAKPQTVTFFSHATEHELVRQCKNDKPLPDGGGWMNDRPGVKYKFYPAIDESGQLVGRLDLFVGQHPMRDHMGALAPGEDDSIERDAPEWVRAHRSYGQDFWQAPVPMRVIRGRIRTAIANLAQQDLVTLLAEERDVSNRPEIVAEAEDSLALVREQIAAIEAAKAEQEAVQAPKAKAAPKQKASA